MISLEEARARILEALRPLPAEEVAVLEAQGRCLTTDLTAPFPLPPFDNASVDGYAVHTADLHTASAGSPVRLPVAARIAAGKPATTELAAGACARIFTGAAVPKGADAVVMQEDVRVVDGGGVEFIEPVTPWEGIRFAGEDLRAGAVLVPAGQRLSAAHLALLSAGGSTRVTVHRRPRVALLGTGDELVEPGQPLAHGQLYDSNRTLLTALVRAAGAEITRVGRAPDDLRATVESLREHAQGAEVLLTTGGVSVGDADFVQAAFKQLGGQVEFWKIAMKPGKPFVWGRLGETHWFGLPGNPVSAFATWWLLVRPALRRLAGQQDTAARRLRATLGEVITNRSDRRHFLRARWDAAGRLRSSGTQASHIQSSLAEAQALLDVPPQTRWETGREVEVELLEDF